MSLTNDATQIRALDKDGNVLQGVNTTRAVKYQLVIHGTGEVLQEWDVKNRHPSADGVKSLGDVGVVAEKQSDHNVEGGQPKPSDVDTSEKGQVKQ